MPLFRSRSHFRVPTIKLAPLIVAVAAILLIGGIVALVVIEPNPPRRHYEITVPSERLQSR